MNQAVLTGNEAIQVHSVCLCVCVCLHVRQTVCVCLHAWQEKCSDSARFALKEWGLSKTNSHQCLFHDQRVNVGAQGLNQQASILRHGHKTDHTKPSSRTLSHCLRRLAKQTPSLSSDFIGRDYFCHSFDCDMWSPSSHSWTGQKYFSCQEIMLQYTSSQIIF